MPVSVPIFIKQAWASVGTKFTIPDNANPTTGRAGWDQGFSPINLTPVAAGGIPPFGQDMNGVLYDITSAIQYIQAGRSFPYNQDFADAVGGYGKGSLVSLESDLSIVYKSKVDNNLTPPPSENWDIQGVIQTPTNPIQGSFKNLKLSASGLSSLVSVTCDQIILENPSLETKKFFNVNLSINTASIGLNGLDTGALVSSTWYSVWVISDGVNVRGLISLSASSPAMPTGYTYKSKVWSIYTDSTANKFPLSSHKVGRVSRYKPAAGSNLTALRMPSAGAIGTWSSSTPVYAEVSLTAFAPSEAVKVCVGVMAARTGAGAQSNVAVAPNAAYSGTRSTTPPLLTSTINGGTDLALDIAVGDIVLESRSIFVVSQSAGGAVFIYGWEDDL